MGAPVGELAAAVLIPPSEFIMTSFLDIRDIRGRAFPEIPVEPFGNLAGLEGAADRVVADAGLGRVDLADASVANQLAGQPVAIVGALLAAGLEDAVVFSGRLDHRLAFLDGQRQRFFAVDVTAGLHRGDRGQRVPVVDRADRDGVQVFPWLSSSRKSWYSWQSLPTSLAAFLAWLESMSQTATNLTPGFLLAAFHDASALPSHTDGRHHDLVVRAGLLGLVGLRVRCSCSARTSRAYQSGIPLNVSAASDRSRNPRRDKVPRSNSMFALPKVFPARSGQVVIISPRLR